MKHLLIVASILCLLRVPVYAQAPADRQAIVQQVINAAPVDNTSEAAILKSVLRVIAALPAVERAGLLRKDGGENITFYAPAGVNVSISRVAYPNGDIAKIFSDAGPGGTNGPIWTLEGNVGVDRYVPVVGDVPNPGPVVPNPGSGELLQRVITIEQVVAQIRQQVHDHEQAEAGDRAASRAFEASVSDKYAKALKWLGRYAAVPGIIGAAWYWKSQGNGQ